MYVAIAGCLSKELLTLCVLANFYCLKYVISHKNSTHNLILRRNLNKEYSQPLAIFNLVSPMFEMVPAKKRSSKKEQTNDTFLRKCLITIRSFFATTAHRSTAFCGSFSHTSTCQLLPTTATRNGTPGLHCLHMCLITSFVPRLSPEDGWGAQ